MENQQSKLITLTPFPDKTKNISLGGDKEKEMIQKFNAFDIIWYAPEDSEKLEKWIAFTNVNVQKTSDFNEFCQIAFKSRFFSFIIIATGSFAEKTIPLISPELLIPNIIIYCKNLDYHKKWSEKYESIIEIFTHPVQIFDYLLNLQNLEYNIPLFSYRIKYGKEFNCNYYDCLNKIEYKSNNDNFYLILNDYEKFCVKTFHDYRLSYLNYGNGTYFLDFMIEMIDSIFLFDLFYGEFPYPILNAIIISKELNRNLMALTLISL